MNDELFTHLVTLETSLLQEEVRKSKTKLDQLLADNFEEIGSSGKRYNKQQIIEALLTEIYQPINAYDFEMEILSNDTAKLSFKTHRSLESKASQTVLRYSLWQRYNEEWKLVFHQGTIVSSL